MLDRKIAPSIVDAVQFDLKLQPYQKYVLNNGVEVYTVDAGTEDVLLVEWVFNAGNWFEEKNLIAALTNYLLKNGTVSKNAYALNDYFEYYGAYLNRNSGAEYANVTLHCLTKHLETLLPVVREIFTEATLPPSEMDIAIQNMKQKLEVNLKKSSFVAGRLIDTYLFGSAHPYGRFSSYEDFDALTHEDIAGFYDRYYRKGGFKIFIAGKLPAHPDRLMNKYFGDLENQATSSRIHPAQPSAEKKYRIVNDKNSAQSSIRLARSFGNRHHEDFLKAQVLNVLFGGFFGSRLMTNIREDKGYTYGIHSYLLGNKADNGWMISTEAGRDVSEAAIEEVYKEMERLRETPVTSQELLLVKNFMMGAILGDLDGPFQILTRWKTILLNELDPHYFERTIQNIKAIQGADLQEIARRYLRPEDFYELVVT